MHDPYAVEKRKPLTAKQKLKMFLDQGGICCICGGKIDSVKDAWDEHVNPLWLNGDNSAPNRAPAHVKCARQKTAVEAKQRAKGRKVAERHFGVKTSRGKPMMGTKRSGWKRKLNGLAVRRDDE